VPKVVDDIRLPAGDTVLGHRPYELIGFGTLHGPKPYVLIGFCTIHGPKPYELIGFGTIHGPKPYELIGFGTIHWMSRGCFIFLFLGPWLGPQTREIPGLAPPPPEARGFPGLGPPRAPNKYMFFWVPEGSLA
jgi:hypothetical protein